MDDAVTVALEGRAQPAFLLGGGAAPTLVRAHGEGREPGLLLLPDPRFERVRNPPGKLGHTKKTR